METLKNNYETFNANSTYFKNDYCGLLKREYYIPIPIQVYPLSSYTEMEYITGQYVGTSFRPSKRFKNYNEAKEWCDTNEKDILLIVKTTIARL